MTIDIFGQKFYDIIIISLNEIYYFKLKRENVSFKILKAETISENLYDQGILKFEKLEKNLGLLISKHKLKELGIVLNMPNILFQKISLPRTGANIHEAIVNYLRANFPLPLERYTFFYKEDKFKISQTISNFKIFFIEKSIIDNLLTIIEKFNLIPLFITSSIEILYQYLLSKSLIDFNEEYITFFVDKDILIVLLIKNLRIEKVFIEEIDLEKSDFNFLINRFYSFLKPNLSSDAKILFFTDKKDKILDITHNQIFFDVKPHELLIEGSYLIFNKVFADQEFTDFLPLKNYTSYFLNRLPSVAVFLIVYLLFLTSIFSGFYFFVNSYLKKDIQRLSLERGSVNNANLVEINDQLKRFVDLSDKLNLKILENFDKIKLLLNFENFNIVNYSLKNPLTFYLKVKRDNLEDIKNQINQIFPNSRLVQEELYFGDEVKLYYSF